MSRKLGATVERTSAKQPARARKAPRGLPTKTLAIDVVVNSGLWKSAPAAEEIVKKTIAEAAAAVSKTAGEVAIVLTDDLAIRTLNREWRKKDAATNVLSFPMPKARAGGAVTLLGDIVIAYETTAREADAESKPFGDHLAHLAVHGFLHLVGYDHETDQEAEAMENLEAEILSRLGVPNPYEPRASAAVQNSVILAASS
jgi:probable rRNA maturation factor